MSIQVLSDVHLEMRGTYDFPQAAPMLVLAGDIGNPGSPSYARFLCAQADRFEKVFVVKGNHECYNRTPAEADQLIAAVCSKRPNLVQLDQTAHALDADHVLLGCTLWSHVPPKQRLAVGRSVADHLCIDGWSVEANNRQHAKEVAWLRGEVRSAELRGKLAVVVTHHAPSFFNTSAPQYASSPHNSAFATDLEDMLCLPVVAWIFGHTHWSCYQRLPSGCRLVSNQLGYPGERTFHSPELCIELD